VGYWRSHTRPGLYLDQEDYSVILTYFSNPSQVFLLVKPSMGGAERGRLLFLGGRRYPSRVSLRGVSVRPGAVACCGPVHHEFSRPPPAGLRTGTSRMAEPGAGDSWESRRQHQ